MTRFLIPVVAMVGHMLKPLTEPSVVPAASAKLFQFKGHSTKQHTFPLSPLCTSYGLIKYTNYKPLGWLFWLTKEAKTKRTGFKQPFGDSFPSTVPPKLPLQITSHFQVLLCATASKGIYLNCFHCYCLKNHIFSKKPTSVSVVPKWQDIALCWFLQGIFLEVL